MPRATAPVISGGALRGVRLRGPAGWSTRPTRTRVRTSIFDMLGARVQGARVLDLYAGSGALGLDALSRGAAHATFVERDTRALQALRDNLQTCRVPPERARILRVDAQRWEPPADAGYDLVLADPPFALQDPLPAGLAAPGVLTPDALVVLESPSERVTPLRGSLWTVVQRRVYGVSAISLYRPARHA
jgi:16S rRNA (guanine966-N2)-methyltransferase